VDGEGGSGVWGRARLETLGKSTKSSLHSGGKNTQRGRGEEGVGSSPRRSSGRKKGLEIAEGEHWVTGLGGWWWGGFVWGGGGGVLVGGGAEEKVLPSTSRRREIGTVRTSKRNTALSSSIAI